MAPISFYDFSIGNYIKALNVLLRILKTASSYPDVASFLDARLAPDMFPLAKQVRYATRYPITLAEALTGKQLVTWNETRMMWGEEEKAWPELIARVEKTLAMLQGVDPKEAEAKADDTKMPLQVAADSNGAAAFRDIPAADFTMANGLPNVFFHVYMVYAILRSKGVDVGKKDVLISFLPGYIMDELVRKQAV
ncbi:hypothetical protein MMC11_007464 [Xylographa trunciseda]|nr:hypothetical protein [Xylographa trunciseda]